MQVLLRQSDLGAPPRLVGALGAACDARRAGVVAGRSPRWLLRDNLYPVGRSPFTSGACPTCAAHDRFGTRVETVLGLEAMPPDGGGRQIRTDLATVDVVLAATDRLDAACFIT